jgi:hypothetical protein
MCDDTSAENALVGLRSIAVRRPDLYDVWGAIAVVAQSVDDKGKRSFIHIMFILKKDIVNDDEAIMACRNLLSLNPWAKHDILLNQLIGRRLARIQRAKMQSAAEKSTAEYNIERKGRVIVSVEENEDTNSDDQDEISSVKSTSSNDNTDWTKS